MLALVAFIFIPAAVTFVGIASDSDSGPEEIENAPDGSAFAPPTQNRSIRDIESMVIENVPGRELAFEFERSTTRIIDDNYAQAVAESDRVLLGEDNWLFISDATDQACVEPELEAEWSAEIASLHHLLESAGKTMVFAIAPDRSGIAPELMGDIEAPCHAANELVVDRLANQPGVIDLGTAVNTADHALQIDTHWSPAGAMAGMELVVDAIDPDVWEERGLSSEAVDRPGDLDGLVGYDNTESVNLITIDQPEPSTIAYVDTSIEGRPLAQSTTPGAADTHVLMVHDSFGGYFPASDPTHYLSGLGHSYLRPWFTRVDNVRVAGRTSNTIADPAVAQSMTDADAVAFLFVQRTLHVRLATGFLSVPTAVALSDQLGVPHEVGSPVPTDGVVVLEGLGGVAADAVTVNATSGSIAHRVDYPDSVAVSVPAGTTLSASLAASSTVFVATN